jgi:short-subunit dehydrogenase
MLMKDKICLITGATDGIGKETARCLGKQNAQLILVGRNLEKERRLEKNS